jgi:hypothetical protein
LPADTLDKLRKMLVLLGHKSARAC